MSKKKIWVAATVVVSSVYLAGCGLFGNEDKKEKIDPPQTVSYLKEGEALQELENKNETKMIEKDENIAMTELYLIDKNGYVVSQTFPLPNTKSLAKQALEYLVADGPISNMLPNGFRAVLPAGTQVLSVDIKEGKAVVDFSPEFKEYQADDEERIIQSVTWTLTQFDSVDEVELRVNGERLKEMPVNGTTLDPKGLSRAVGINHNIQDVVDMSNTRAITVYYMAQKDDGYYYVPVTKRVSNLEKDNVTAIVNELAEGPGLKSNLVSEFLPDVQLIDKPVIDDGKVTLNFNESILGSFEERVLSQNLLNTLVLSLTEQENIKSVAIQVNGKTNFVNEKGEKVSESVTRPESVNTGSF
ncbi:germination protein M [Oikeobacillus pervagus]|uniref:Germination protein M n=1 Tax=Oikeobacillus pervagus TaxID=1325931 RepID=A0AAJ1T3V6_9BACI|nr:GerMN domain-containing protein [Oikeobacillus pervagus]MDQ0215424.1 germination protein M [Oikeobacillus pervagus]